MKTLPEAFIASDEAEKRQPCELYHIWMTNGSHWRYTSGDSEIIYDGQIYGHATLKRSAIKYNESLKTMQVTISAGYIHEPALQYIALNPIEIVWVQILKIFRDQKPYQAATLFTGTIKSVSFKGLVGEINCTGFEYFLKREIPRERYQPSCNVFLYSEKCMVDQSQFLTEGEISSISSDGKQLTVTACNGFEDNYFAWGYVVVSGKRRMIVAHERSTLSLRYPIEAAQGDSVQVYAGCNGTPETCLNKFDNIENFQGHPFVPIDNPVLWS